MFHATTIVAVRKDGEGAMGGDGQVTFEKDLVMKHGARKVRRLFKGKVLAGFAGSATDAFALFERFEGELERKHGNLRAAAEALAKQWRTDRVLRRLEALLVVMDESDLLVLSGAGDVIEPDDGVIAVGSGGGYALAAARALLRHSDLGARAIVEAALHIAADICVYTNHQLTIEEI